MAGYPCFSKISLNSLSPVSQVFFSDDHAEMSTQEQQQQAARCIPTRSSLGTSLACLLASLAPGLVYYALLSEAAAFPPQSAAPLAILANLGFLFHLPLVLLLVARWLLHSSTFSTSSLLHVSYSKSALILRFSCQIALSLVTLLSLALTWREVRGSSGKPEGR